MKNLIAGLKWFARFLENRFPEKLDLSKLATKIEVSTIVECVDIALKSQKEAIAALQEDNKKFKEQIQILSLRSGLIRPMQTVLKEKI